MARIGHPPPPPDEITFVFDIETDGFKPSLIHCIAALCVETQEMFLFANHPDYIPIETGIQLLLEADWLVAHNGLAYDIPVMEALYPAYKFDRKKVIDTLPLVRKYFKRINESDMRSPEVPYFLKGKHKLEAWGHRLGILKGDFGKNANWKIFSHRMVDYCALDVKVTAELHQLLLVAAVEKQ